MPGDMPSNATMRVLSRAQGRGFSTKTYQVRGKQFWCQSRHVQGGRVPACRIKGGDVLSPDILLVVRGGGAGSVQVRILPYDHACYLRKAPSRQYERGQYR